MSLLQENAYNGIANSLLNAHGADPFGIIDWVNQHDGGYFNPKQLLTHAEADDANSRLMLYASDNIEQGEVLSTIPWELLIGPDDFADFEVTGILDCETTNKLAMELERNTTSDYAPLVNYFHSIPKNQIPSVWSEEGKDLLLEVLGMPTQEIPPGEPVHVLDEEWFADCGGDEKGSFAATLVLQRGLYKSFIAPTFDWYTHRNGDFFNVEIDVQLGKYVQVLARRAIKRGEPLHHSVDMCKLCNEEAVENGYGTPEILRDFGFVEKFPQRWTFNPNAVVLETEKMASVYTPEQITFSLIQTDGSIEVEWADHLLFDDSGRNYVRRLFRKELRRLHRLENIRYSFQSEPHSGYEIPLNEWKTISEYYQAIRNALHGAIDSLVNEDDGTGFSCQSNWSANEGSCSAPHLETRGIHYDDLKEEEDDLNYIFPTCETTQLLEFYEYDELEEIQTNYQKLWFVEREDDGDICMNLEDTLQICSNYRPHYHEFFVHFPARYIDKIERVIFIGGGDSMLLHEVLKYPSLKKVVGLELDQQVTRKSFNYFRSQPHWDNDKVEWWYGDATKSLPLLPQDYWGSFDLVLVDLSETVMSFSVTQTMDIFSALSLLLKPEGIMVKNEPYIDQFSEFFDYSIHVFYGTPKICTQVLVMGSNGVDFLHHPTKDHGVERLLLEPLDDDENLRYKYLHDYRKTDAGLQGKCSKEQVTKTEHGRKAGVIEILEAEGVDLSTFDSSLERILYDIAKSLGLNPLSVPTINSFSATTIVMMKEGYIVGRSLLEKNYIAFDVNLWGAFAKQNLLRSRILDAVKATASSSYRIVLGGMHGTNTWEEDKSEIGIQVSQRRNCEKYPSLKEQQLPYSTEKKVLAKAIPASVSLVSETEKVGIVLCGREANDCLGEEVLGEMDFVQIERIWTCPGISEHDFEILESNAGYKCEVEVLQQLVRLNNAHGEVDIVVIDKSAPQFMVQILHSILSVEADRDALLAENHVFVTFTDAVSEDYWRKNMLERYRRESHKFPVSRAEVVIENDKTNIECHVLAVNQPSFFNDLRVFESTLRSNLSAFDVEVKTVTGGMLYFDSDYDTTVFEPNAYDPKPAIQQAQEQNPLGRQSIFQFEAMETILSSSPDGLSLLNGYLEDSLNHIGYDSSSVNRWETYSDVGDGAAIVAVFTGGSAILVWDGVGHVDINLFTSNQFQAQADAFVEAFVGISNLTKTLRDDQPRGSGRVVQFQHELPIISRNS